MEGLTHYTRTVEAVAGIIRNGFAWVPNRRNLMPQFVPSHDFSGREPQQFGMISFTDWSPPAPVRHRQDFGDFGIVVSRAWANEQMAQRVIYVSEDGPVSVTLRWLFTAAYEHLKNTLRYPDDAVAQMAFENKAVAGVEGASLWANLLTLYEYLEPEGHAYQSEWRMVQSLPDYSHPSSKVKIIERVSPPKGWAKFTAVLHAPDEAISGFVCPRRYEESFRRTLPAQMSERSVVLY